MAIPEGLPTRSSRKRSVLTLTLFSVLAFGIGLAGGTLVSSSPAAWSGGVVALAGDLVRAWTNGFRLIVGPLVATQLYVAVSTARLSKAEVGRVGLATPAVFIGLLGFVALLTITGALLILDLPFFGRIALPSVESGSAPSATLSGPDLRWVDQIIPSNLFASAATDNILPLMLFALVFAVAAKRLSTERGAALTGLIDSVREVTFVLVTWLIRLAPVVLFGVGLQAGATSGLRTGEGLLVFTGLEVSLVLVAILALYPVMMILGRIPPGALVRALAPAQITAVASRSSLATIPALLKGCNELGINAAVSAAILPLAGATLKVSRAVSSPLKLVFLSHFLNIPLGIEQVVVFAITIILLSPGTAGVPSLTSGTRSLPAFVAAGIPPEYVVLLGVVTAVTDFLLTLMNTTGYLAATTLIARFAPNAVPMTPPTPASTSLADSPVR